MLAWTGIAIAAVPVFVGAVFILKPDLATYALDRLGLRDQTVGRGIAEWAHSRSEPLAEAPRAGPRTVMGLGRLVPEGEVIRVAAPSGLGEFRLEQLLVSEGDRVERGARLAALDTERKLEAALDQMQANVAQRQAALDRTRRVVESERAQRHATVARAGAEVETAKAELGRTEALQAKGVSTAALYDQRFLAFRQASERLKEAEAGAIRYAGTLDEQPDLILAHQELVSARAAVAQAEVEYSQAFITAPLSGRVLKIHYRPGERIGSKGLLDMGATDRMMVKAEVYESDVGRLSNGQSATITAAPFAEPLTGLVERVGLQVQQQSVVDALPAANTDARVVETWIRLDLASADRASALTGLQVRVRVQP